MITRATRPVRHHPLETQIEQLLLVDEDIDYPNRIVFVNPVFQTIREQRRLAPIDALDKSFHPITPIRTGEESHPDSNGKKPVLTQPATIADIRSLSRASPFITRSHYFALLDSAFLST